jgi:protein-disulfide isomerase
VPELFKFGKQAGFTQESFDKCLTDQKLMDDIVKIRSRAADGFGVASTPTFFINGKRMTGAPTLEEFDKAFSALLKS